jgi:hypothetical protein
MPQVRRVHGEQTRGNQQHERRDLDDGQQHVNRRETPPTTGPNDSVA